MRLNEVKGSDDVMVSQTFVGGHLERGTGGGEILYLSYYLPN